MHVFNSCILQGRMRVRSYNTHSNWSPCWSHWRTQSTEHQVHMLVPADSKVLIVSHMACASWWVPRAGHSCFVTRRAGQALLYASSMCHAACDWGGEKKPSCWRPSVSLLEVNLILFLTVAKKMGLKDLFFFPLKHIFGIHCWKTSKYPQ